MRLGSAAHTVGARPPRRVPRLTRRWELGKLSPPPAEGWKCAKTGWAPGKFIGFSFPNTRFARRSVSSGGKPARALPAPVWGILSVPLPSRAWGPRSGRAGRGCGCGGGGSCAVLGEGAGQGMLGGGLSPALVTGRTRTDAVPRGASPAGADPSLRRQVSTSDPGPGAAPRPPRQPTARNASLAAARSERGCLAASRPARVRHRRD